MEWRKKPAPLRGEVVRQFGQKLREKKEALGKLKFAHAISPIENPMKIRESKKVIARLQTELKAKELAK